MTKEEVKRLLRLDLARWSNKVREVQIEEVYDEANEDFYKLVGIIR